jgi:predicted RNase H-like nuclease
VSGRVAVGFDGCPAGWVAVTLVDGAVRDVEVVARLAPAVAVRGPAAIAIDMPIGLVDGIRDADVAARRLLPGRASSVFSTPPRAVVDGWRDGTVTTHAQATALAVATTGKGLSQQAWRLVPKIAEVDDLAADLANPPDGAVTPGVTSPPSVPVLEVHPEVAFTVVTGRAASAEALLGRVQRAPEGARRPRRRPAGPFRRRRARRHPTTSSTPRSAPGSPTAPPWASGSSRSPRTPAQHDRGRPIAIHARTART